MANLTVGGTTLRCLSDIARHERLEDNDAPYVDHRSMLTELREDNKRFIALTRQAQDVCNEHNDMASVGVLENFIDQAEKRAWFLYDSRSSAPTLNRGGNMSGWRLIGLYVYCVLLTGLATAFAAAFATAPYWIWPALKSASAWFL